ncbi:MAG: hypothetical protein DMG24_20100, partial [Acidobacteria bacterium]
MNSAWVFTGGSVGVQVLSGFEKRPVVPRVQSVLSALLWPTQGCSYMKREQIPARRLKARRILWVPVLTVVALLLSGRPELHGQEVGATLYGVVTDPGGAAVPEASLTITNSATGFTVTKKTGPDGSYVVTSLPVGTYTITVE